MGLLLPAVQSARESGRRTKCMNNLNQLGKAAIAYDGATGRLPGWKNPNVSYTLTREQAISTPPFYSWPVELLPHLERRDIYSLAQSNPGVEKGGTGAPGSLPENTGDMRLSLLLCPTGGSDGFPDSSLSPSNYIGNCGNFGFGMKGDGVLTCRIPDGGFAAASVSLSFVSAGDGTTNTLLFSERSGPNFPYAAGWNSPQAPNGFYIYGNGFGAPAFVLAGLSTEGKAINRFEEPLTVPNPFGPGEVTYPSETTFSSTAALFPSSYHPGGVCITFCDGRTEFIRDTIPLNVYSQLLTSRTAAASPPYRALPILNEADFR